MLPGDWETLREETDGNTGTSFIDSTDKGDRQYVYRVRSHNARGFNLHPFQGDWAFNGGDPDSDPGGDPETAEHISRVGENLTASTSGISDQDGLTNVSCRYQWTAGGSDLDGATGSGYLLTSNVAGQTIRVKVSFTDDRNNRPDPDQDCYCRSGGGSGAAHRQRDGPRPGGSRRRVRVHLRNRVQRGDWPELRDPEVPRLQCNGRFRGEGGEKGQAQQHSMADHGGAQGAGDVPIEPPATTDCRATGAICTGDGRKLSNSLSYTVAGPGQ